MLRTTFGLLLSLALSTTVFAHCQVPCGIFTDQLRFEQLLEDEQTIAKAEHAAKVQETIATYFLAQRIKADSPRYMEQLKAAHAVTVAAMKCKQSTDAATAKALEDAIFNLYRAYEGKEPAFKHSH
jgi:nickel superoxide dismutase